MSKKPTTKDQKVKVKTSKVSWLVFLATLIVVLISLTTILFPSLVVRSTSQFRDIVINPYETGVWTYPVLVANFILLSIGILYFKNKLPQQITKAIQFIFSFEVSRKLAFIVFVILLTIYIGFTVGELASEEIWEDYTSSGVTFEGVRDRVSNWSINHIKDSPSEPHLRYMLLSFSLHTLGNIRIIPFIVSIALLITTYFVTKEISQKRFAGLVAVAFVLQSSVFLIYDTSATYDNVWILLYLVSLYTIFKKWPLSLISYILSIPAKALTVLFLPMTFFFIYRTKDSRQKKIRLAISYGVIIAIVIVALSIANTSSSSGFDANDFWRGFTALAFQLRFDAVVLIFILPLIVGLFIASRKGIIQADSILILIMGVLLSAPILQGFTDLTNQPYRFVPLVVFFAMGIGTILSKKPNENATN
ncbi:MAG: hypothetical protein ACREAE_07285 [Nitrosopumilaceae archaeon]